MENFDPHQPGSQSGIRVRQITNPGCRGTTTGRIRRSGTRTYVEIETDAHTRSYIEDDDLEPLVSGVGPREQILARSFGRLGDLARILTYHKISSDLSNVFYAMQASRTDFYAYQFKPVYKFIESLNGRLLITDEVGLGKTIEAGLIWTELRARTDAHRLLIVCPSMLLEKWKNELRTRFSLDAQIYDSQGLRSLITDFLTDGENFHCHALCSLQTIRQESIREKLNELDDRQLKFDLVIVDEAHHLRNAGTQSHSTGKILSDLASSMIFLTATPIHLKNEDLFRLLSILDSEEFGQQAIFEQRLQQNEPVIRAQNAIRSYPVNIGAALEQIRQIQNLSWFKENRLVDLIRQRLEKLDPDDTNSIVEIGRLIENINLFGSIISRTRKREVQEWRVIRDPVVYPVILSEMETEFYTAVTQAVIDAVSEQTDLDVAAFSLMMPQRQMASSIPAMVSYYTQLDSSPVETEPVETEEDLLTESMLFGVDEYPAEFSPARLPAVISNIIAKFDRKIPDTKFTRFREILEDQLVRNRRNKIVVFSYFRKTLEYLQRELARSNIRSLVIHGHIPMEERLQRITEFRESAEVNVLLSSEVGSEGIDLQFANVLINYDLPWNPMKIEQRIGRLDRLGQQSEKITIINFAVRGTIEEKILTKLYDRIEIFKHSLGDLEPILGKLIQELTSDLLSQQLTAEEIESRIEQTQRAILQKRQLENELVEESAVLFGSADYILEQIGRARKLGRWITPEDLKGFVADFFDRYYQDTVVDWDSPQRGLVTIRLPNHARNDLHLYCRNQAPALMTVLTQPGQRNCILAFQNDVAQANQRMELLNHLHPLIQWIVHHHRNNPSAFNPTAAVEVRSNMIREGTYLISLDFWEFSGLRKEVQLAVTMCGVNQDEKIPADLAEELIQELLRHGQTWEYAYHQVEPSQLREAIERSEQIQFLNLDRAFETYRVRNDATYQRQRTNLISYRDRKQEEWAKRISTLRANTGKTGQIRGFESTLQKHLEECQRRIERLESRRQPSRQIREIAVVLCRVINH